MLAFGMLIIFAAFDYVGYNTLGQWKIVLYRVIQTVVQLSLAAFLWHEEGFWSAFAFMLFWWTWNADLLYYLFYDLFRFFGGDSAGNAFETEVLGGKVTWASWTPYGLVARTIPNKKLMPIGPLPLLLQAFVGFVLSVFILMG